MGLAIVSYANDYQGMAPPQQGSTVGSSYTYIMTLWKLQYAKFADYNYCPSQWPYYRAWPETSSNCYYYTLGMRKQTSANESDFLNRTFNIYDNKIEVTRLSKLKGEPVYFSPSQFFLLADSVKRFAVDMPQVGGIFTTGNGETVLDGVVHLRHSQRANMWFADGSVRGISSGETADLGIHDGQRCLQ